MAATKMKTWTVYEGGTSSSDVLTEVEASSERGALDAAAAFFGVKRAKLVAVPGSLKEQGTSGYRVAYLVPNPRRGQPGQETMLRLWYAGKDVVQTMAEAMADLRAAKRRGYTAWVADSAGRHVPVKGASRPYPDAYTPDY